MKHLLLMIIVVFITSSCVTMTQKEFDQIQKVAVVTEVKDNLFLQDKGVTVFENSDDQSGIEEWQLSSYLTERAIKSAKEKAPRRVFHVIPNTKMEYITEAMKDKYLENGYDTLLLIRRIGLYNPVGGGYYEVSPDNGGFMVYARSILGLNATTRICARYALSLIRIWDWKPLAFASSKETCKFVDFELKNFKDYSEEELFFINRTLTEVIDNNIQKDVAKLFEIAPPKKKAR